MSGDRCKHQDLVSFWSGNRLLVERNSFGVYRYGAAQLYLIRGVDRVSIVNNVFRGTDQGRGLSGPRGDHRREQGFEARPRGVRIVNNTILTGARRIDGYAGSIRMSGVYWRLQRYRGPVLANNVIGLLEDPHHVCSVSRKAISNLVLRGVRAEVRIASARRTWIVSGAQRVRQPCSSIERADGLVRGATSTVACEAPARHRGVRNRRSLELVHRPTVDLLRPGVEETKVS